MSFIGRLAEVKRRFIPTIGRYASCRIDFSILLASHRQPPSSDQRNAAVTSKSTPLILKSVLALCILSWASVVIADEFDAMPSLTLADTSLPANPKKHGTAVTVIDRQMIDASGARSLGEILRIVPGVTTGYRFGHTLSIGTQGGAEEFSRKISLLIDDRNVFTPTSGALFSFNLVPLEDIERIEVYRGPDHSEFGSNAMLMTVKIYTAYAAERQGTKLSYRQGGNGIKDTYIQHGDTVGPVSWTASYNGINDNGLTGRQDDTHKQQIFARADYQSSSDNQFNVTMGAAHSNIDYWLSSNLTSGDHEAQDDTWFLNTSWTHMFSDTMYSTTNVSHSYLDRDSSYTAAPLPGVGRLNYTPGYTLQTTAIDTKIVKDFSFVDVSIGGKYSFDNLRSDSLFKKDEYNIEDRSIYSNQKWHLTNSTTLNTGFMAESSSFFSGNTFARNASIVQEVGFQNTFRIGYSEGTRFPLMYEQESARKATLLDLGGMPVYDIYNVNKLKPEEMRQYEAAWMWGTLDKTLNTEVRFFVNKYDNSIAYVAAPNPGVLSQTGNTVVSAKNLHDTSSVKGVEVNIDWRPAPGFMVVASGSYNDIDAYIAKNTYSNNIGDNGPSNIFSLLGQYSFGQQWRVGGMLTRVQSFNWANGWALETQKNLDLYVEKCFGGLVGTKVCTKLAGSNLLGDEANFRPEATTPRTFWAEASVSF
ncbi:TonB-dependent receptor [Pseudomonas amygdali pv. lachrymans]|uniref:TonB-dependent receptor n=1 Tax=Pseudomonas amygdali pv. lachrymans TaxID=53707 RepID=A0ABR5KRY6_PSEAV|nr:TonB-dependent receptor [Pseudomonas amygdali pv. lachrymans]